MPRFYFSVRDEAGEAPDQEGAELPDVEAALMHAATGARCIMSESIKRGTLNFAASIGIEGEDRTEVARLTFGEAVKIHE
jgi:hypothetical protein